MINKVTLIIFYGIPMRYTTLRYEFWGFFFLLLARNGQLNDKKIMYTFCLTFEASVGNVQRSKKVNPNKGHFFK
jgi:hypothetical protein